VAVRAIQGNAILSGDRSKVDAGSAAPAQLDLLVSLPSPAPIETALDVARARARAFVDGVKAARVCRRCGTDEGLMFVHRRAHVLNREIGKLVLWGVSTGRLREEIARCDVYCRRCWLAGTWNPTPRCCGSRI
jgi:hypothetical protein